MYDFLTHLFASAVMQDRNSPLIFKLHVFTMFEKLIRERFREMQIDDINASTLRRENSVKYMFSFEFETSKSLLFFNFSLQNF